MLQNGEKHLLRGKFCSKTAKKTLVRDRSLFTPGGGMVKFRGEREIIFPERGGDAKFFLGNESQFITSPIHFHQLLGGNPKFINRN